MRPTLILFFSLFSFLLSAQNYSFEGGTYAPFSATNAELSLVQAPYKDGINALEWKWTAMSELKVDYAVTHKNFRDGVIFWIYNEIPSTNPLKAAYRDANNNVQYSFEFGLNYKGWRICRIGSKYMKGSKQVSSNLKLHLLSPTGVSIGRLFIDRFSFVADVDYQNAPDAQQPQNTDIAYITHWSSLWKWESTLNYAQPQLARLSASQTEALNKTEQTIATLIPVSANTSLITNAKSIFTSAGIKRLGNFIIGSPLVVNHDSKTGDIDFAKLGTMLMGLAQDAVFNNNNASRDNFLLVWDYAINQGFTWGSAMGNNHHYGYEIRDIFKATFLMRNELKAAGKIQVVADALAYWSGLAESRTTLDLTRDGLVDSWNTLLFERLISAMLIPTDTQSYRAVESLVAWTESSLAFTPGNMGGIKPDGAVFHHAGHYPAYATGGLAGLGTFMAAIQPGGFKISVDARRNMSNALFAMSYYTNFKDWTIGLSGRHPHAGAINNGVVEAFATLALMGGIDKPEDSYDKKLAAEFLRLDTENNPLRNKFTGLSAANTPEGFFVMNHAALGVHRVGNSMVSIKGYNSDVWGSEIYTNDNRYGRYQSYGAVEILNGGSPVSRTESRFSENGWDWNRLPGTTTIHLPLNLLESPSTATLMARSEEDFAGASSLLGQFGVFGMKLKEKNDINNTNYTPDFTARKSVFAFGKRLICIGTDISNSNSTYTTETTLFQNAIKNSSEEIAVNGTAVNIANYNFDSGQAQQPTVISDVNANYYRISERNKLIISGGGQISAHNKTKAETRGNFVTARINHGQAPVNANYEYMIMLKPTPIERIAWTSDPKYKVLQADRIAHIVYDEVSGVNAYVCFEPTNPTEGIVKGVQEETLLMYKKEADGSLKMSVCDPSLHLPVKTKNSEPTYMQGLAVSKLILIEGKWEVGDANSNLELSYQNENTKLLVNCKLGLPVEFTLTPKATSVQDISKNKIIISKQANSVIVNGATEYVALYTTLGRMIDEKNYNSASKIFHVTPNNFYLISGRMTNQTTFIKKILL